MIAPVTPHLHRPSLYERLGGWVALGLVSEMIAERICVDPHLSQLVKGLQIGTLKKRIAEFLAKVLGGPTTYQGPHISELCQQGQLSMPHIHRIRSHILAAFVRVGAERSIIEQVLAALNPLMSQFKQLCFPR